MSDLAERLRAAGRDDRLVDGPLYLEAAGKRLRDVYIDDFRQREIDFDYMYDAIQQAIEDIESLRGELAETKRENDQLRAERDKLKEQQP